MLRASLDVGVTEVIARPPDEVWAFVVNAGHLPEWLDEFEEAAVVGEPQEGVGATTRFRLSSGATGTFRVVEWVPGRRMAWDGDPQRVAPLGTARPRGFHELTEEPGGATRMVTHYQPELRGTAVLLRPYLNRWLRRQRPIDHARLKDLVEAGG